MFAVLWALLDPVLAQFHELDEDLVVDKAAINQPGDSALSCWVGNYELRQKEVGGK